MLRFRFIGLVALGVAGVLSGFGSAPAATGVNIITVTAGKPTEFGFKLSATKVSSMQVTFKVTNAGKVSHQFKVCTTPGATAKLTACSGTSTPLIKPGKTMTLTVAFKQAGTYGFFSSVPGQAAKGMRGQIVISASTPAAKAATTTTSKPATTSPTATTPSASGGNELSGGDATAGAAFFAANCTSCHSLGEVRSMGTITADLNTSHAGGPFDTGPLTTQQLKDLAAFVNQ